MFYFGLVYGSPSAELITLPSVMVADLLKLKICFKIFNLTQHTNVV